MGRGDRAFLRAALPDLCAVDRGELCGGKAREHDGRLMGIASAFALRATARQVAPPILRDLPSSYDEKSMRGVAAELFDEAVFPVEIGLHRTFLDISALIGTAVAV